VPRSAFESLIEVADPFKLLWTERSFDAQKVQE